MKKMSFVFALFLLAAMFYQCRKDLSYIGSSDGGASVLPEPINTSLQGNVMDENNQPAAGVAITAGTSTAITDANGFFHIGKVTLDKNTTLVTAQKDGYFKGYRVFAATSGCNQVVIKLMMRNLAGTIASSSGGDVTLSNGAKVSLPANGVVTASSNAVYSGDVNVYATYINPTAADIANTVPGSFVANNKSGKRVILSSYGMLAVELQTAGGEKLQIKNGSVAKLTIPISSSPSSAPQTIALWYVDETTGIWQEEGTATKQGSNYVGEVKHFSFWNCDYPYNAVTLSFTLQTPDGLPLVNAYVEVMPADSTGGLAHGFTDSLGQVKGLVPANKSLVFKVFSSCGTVAYSQNISPINQSTDLGVIKMTNASSLLTFTGTLLNCNNAPVTYGYALINFNGTTRYVSTDSVGKFTTTYITCSTFPNFSTVLGVDNDAQKQSEKVTVTTTAPLTNAGTIITCGVSSEQYINFIVDGINYNIGDLGSDTLYGYKDSSGYVNISSLRNSADQIEFTSAATTTGTFPFLSLWINDYHYVNLNQPSTVTFTKFPNVVGDFYEGSLTGKFTTNPSTDSAATHIITGTFRVRRDN